MSETVRITRHEIPSGGEYRAAVSDSDVTGYMSWRQVGQNGQDVRLVDHTIVPPAIGGRGIAGQLVKALVADAREQGFHVIPQCSYVVAQFQRHPEWANLKA